MTQRGFFRKTKLSGKASLKRWHLSKDEKHEPCVREESTLGSESNKCKGPEVSMCLAVLL